MIPVNAWEQAKRDKLVAFDLETTGLDCRKDTILGLALAGNGCTYYADFRPTLGDSSMLGILRKLRELLNESKITVVGHNLKFDLSFLLHNGVELSDLKCKFADTMIMAWLIDERKKLGLKALAKSELGKERKEFKEVFPKDSIEKANPRKVATYAKDDAGDTLALYNKFLPILEKQGLDKLFWEMEMPVMMALLEMEQEGMAIDKNVLQIRAAILQSEAKEAKDAVITQAGKEFNIGSSVQVSKLLYDEMGLEPKVFKKKGKSGRYSADKDALKDLAGQGHAIAQNIIAWRTASKELSTYAEPLQEQAVYDKDLGAQLIHANFRPTGTRAGRFSCSNPNLQNQKKGPGIRSAFVSRWKEGKLLICDYSHLHLRIIAHISQDPTMMKMFHDGKDPHQETADECGCDRQEAKAINFGIAYGMSPEGMQMYLLGLGIKESKNKCATYIKRWFNKFPGVKATHKRQVAFAIRNGYVKSITGRRRRLNHFEDWQLKKGAGHRRVINSPVLMSEADIIKVAMRNIKEKQSKNDWLSRVHMICQVHDELIFDVEPFKNVSLDHVYIEEQIKQEMEQAIKLRVPVVVETSWQDNWGQKP